MTTTLRLEIPLDVSGIPDLDKLNSGLSDTEERTGKLGSFSTGIFQGMGQAAFSAGASIISSGISAGVEAIGNSITLASDKAEAASKVNVLFGQSADTITAASEGAAEAVGLSSGKYLEAAGTLGNLLTNFDITGSAAADMSVDMIQLAADVGSFNNADPTEVVEAMGAAFRGEAEPIRRFGVMLDEASVKAKAMELGLYSGQGALDAAARATAVYQLILEDTSAAQGDFARTADGLANAQKIANARIEEAWTDVGEAITPLVAELMPTFADLAVELVQKIEPLVKKIADFVTENEDLVAGIADLLGFTVDLATLGLRVLIDAVIAIVDWVRDWAEQNEGLIGTVTSIASAIGGFVSGVLEELGYRIGGLIGLIIDFAGALVSAGDAIVKLVAGDFAGAAAAGQQALDRLGSFGENVQRVMGDTAIRARDEAEASAAAISVAAIQAGDDAESRIQAAMTRGAEIAGEGAHDIASQATQKAAAGFASNLPAVQSAADDVGSALPAALVEGRAEAARIAGLTPGEMAAEFRAGKTDWRNALDQLKDDIKNAMDPAKELAQLEAALTGKKLAAGLNSSDPIVRNQAEETVRLIETRMQQLTGFAETWGYKAMKSYASGMNDARPSIANAASMAAHAMQERLEARSPAEKGPLSQRGGPEAWIYRMGLQMAHALERGWGRGIDRIDTMASSVYEAVGRPMAPALAPAAAAGGAPGATVYNVTIQAGVGDPVAIGREVVASIQAYERSSGRDWRA